jgi:hypothetical protein
MKNGQTKKTTKPAPEKKARKVRAKMRARTPETFAGHFADKVNAYAKQLEAVESKVSGVPGVDTRSLNLAINSIKLVGVALENAQADGFVKQAGKRGGKKIVFVAGQRVAFKPEAAAIIAKDMPDMTDLVVSVTYDPETDKDSIPLRRGGQGIDTPFAGRFSRKLLVHTTA